VALVSSLSSSCVLFLLNHPAKRLVLGVSAMAASDSRGCV
jgi:hypothetical protein